MIVADLAHETGFFEFCDSPETNEQAQFNAGKRAAFGRLFRCMNLTREERLLLSQAAGAEAASQQK